jgi:hypothetical protein
MSVHETNDTAQPSSDNASKVDLTKHSEFLLNGLQYLKSNNVLCDITLIAESKNEDSKNMHF